METIKQIVIDGPCQYCGRFEYGPITKFEPDGIMLWYQPCPAPDCPSHSSGKKINLKKAMSTTFHNAKNKEDQGYHEYNLNKMKGN